MGHSQLGISFEKKCLIWNNAPVCLVVQAIEGSLDKYSKYKEKMEHLMNFGDIEYLENLELNFC